MKTRFLNSNELKIIACIFMFIDHLGFFFFPDNNVLRIIGRLAMPLFAFFIAEGAHYTKNKIVYLSNILLLGLIISTATFLYTGVIHVDILVTFSLSMILMFIFDEIRDNIYLKNKKYIIIYISIFIICFILILLILNYWYFEYMLYAIIIPFALLICIPKYKIISDNKKNIIKFIVYILAYSLCLLISNYIYKIEIETNIQVFGYLAGLFILLYNNKRGKCNLKYFFYIFYPAHVLLLQLILYIK